MRAAAANGAPVLVILSIIFWYWMWGVQGALLAVPLLAIGHFLGGEVRA